MGNHITITTDKSKNFIRFYQKRGIKSTDGAWSGFNMVRWGWFEDNIITKYITLVGDDLKKPQITFRSIEHQEDPEGNMLRGNPKISTKISDYYLLRPLKPSHSLIFKSTGIFNGEPMTAVSETDYNQRKNNVPIAESLLAELNSTMVSAGEQEGGISREFSVMGDRRTATDEDNAVGLGYLRNIFINVEVIQSHFGIDMKAVGTSTEDGYVLKGVNPKQMIKDSIMSLMRDVSDNFMGVWQFEMIGDPEDPNNTMLRDRNTLSVGKFAYSTFEYEDGSLSLEEKGTYQFPSYKISSTVKSQEFEQFVGNNMQYMATLGNATTDTTPSGNRVLRKFQRQAQVARAGIDINTRKDDATNLARLHVLDPTAGYRNGNEAATLEADSGNHHASAVRSNTLRGQWLKYAPSGEAHEIADGDKSPDSLGKSGTPISWKDGKFQRIEEIDVARAVALNDTASLEAAAGALKIGVDELTAGHGPTGVNFFTGEENSGANIEGVSGEADMPITTDEGGKQVSLDLVSVSETETELHARGKFTAMEIFLKERKDATPIEIKDNQMKIMIEETKPPEKILKVTVSSQEIKRTYIAVKTGANKTIIETMKLKPGLEKLIRTKKDGSGRDQQPLMEPWKETKLSLTIDGIGGLRPGHTFQTDYLPLNYNAPLYASGVDYGPQIIFMVSSHTQQVTSEGWTTTFDGLMQNNPDAEKAYNTDKQKFVTDYFRLANKRAFGLENLPFEMFGKVSKYIGVANDFLTGAKNYLDKNYANTAEGGEAAFSLGQYGKNQGIAKAIHNAETDEERTKIKSQFDTDVWPVGDYDGGFLKNLVQIGAKTVHAGGLALGQGIVGAASVAGVAGAGLGALAGQTILRNPITGVNYLDGGADEDTSSGKVNPGGGAIKEEEILLIDVGAKTDKGLQKGVLDADLNPVVDTPLNFLERIKSKYIVIKKNLRQRKVINKTSKEIPPGAKALLDKIEFTKDEGTVAERADGQVEVTVVTTGTYKEESITKTSTAVGPTVKDAIESADRTNRDLIARELSTILNVWGLFNAQDASGAHQELVAENPGAPFLTDAWNPATGFNKSPFGQFPSSAEARQALAAYMEYDSYTAYANDTPKQTRINQWNASKLWIEGMG
jgi:hypothetical protein